MKMWFIAGILLIVAAEAIPTNYSTPEGLPMEELEYEDECTKAYKSQACTQIINDALSIGTDLRSHFRHYCRAIPAFVPCLERNKKASMTWLWCDTEPTEVFLVFENVITRDEIWNIFIDFLDTANDIACSRTDELIDLIECGEQKGEVLQLKFNVCRTQQLRSIISAFGNTSNIVEPLDRPTICSSLYGFAGCMKDAFVEVCGTDVRDVLDTIYDDVIVEVVGEGLGCRAETNPFLFFGRSLRDKFRR